MRHERPDQTMQATALVHEAYLHLIGLDHVGWQNRAHFFAVSVQMMRRILVDRARSRVTAKRGGAAERVPLKELPGLRTWAPGVRGLSVKEIADVLKISPQSVMRDWKLAKVWLQRELDRFS